MKNILLFTAALFLWSCSSKTETSKDIAEKSAAEAGTVPADNSAIKQIDYYGGQSVKLNELIKQEIAAGRKPVLFFTASWCGPCKEFKSSLPDQLMQEALKNTTLITIDIDTDATKDKIGEKFSVGSFPTFIRVNEAGESVKEVDGGAWDENIPVNMAPVLSKFMSES